jgi:hypothetical protein
MLIGPIVDSSTSVKTASQLCPERDHLNFCELQKVYGWLRVDSIDYFVISEAKCSIYTQKYEFDRPIPPWF